MSVELDPRWEWVEVRRLCDPPGTRFVKGRCNHLEVVPVESAVDGEVVAHLCRTCDTQLPEEWRMAPRAYLLRCSLLGGRGLAPHLVALLQEAGDVALLREIEKASDDDLVALGRLANEGES